MNTTLDTPLRCQQEEQENTTTPESQLQQSQNQEEPGLKCTEPTKVCKHCGGTFTYDQLVKRDGAHRAPRAECRSCANRYGKLSRLLKKENPKPEPHNCIGCGKWLEKKDMVLHHCHETDMFIAYICDRCNLAMGHADDSAATLYNLYKLCNETTN